MKRFFLFLLPVFLALACSLPIPANNEAAGDTPPISAPTKVNEAASRPEFIRREENKLVVGQDSDQIRLRGVNFNNHHWEEDGSVIINSDHHSETDFQRVAEMGMNVIRFNLSYVIFEDDESPYSYKKEGLAWLDQNIQWARKHGVYLIVDMHVPPGGYQGGTDEGETLWRDAESQNRLRALWRAIAERYKDESIIAAWDLLNEPTPSQNGAKWEKLAQKLIDEIRTVDQNHLLIVEVALMEQNGPMFLVTDENVMYDFHFYYPDEYSHQYAYHTGQGDGGSYPNPAVSVLPTKFVWADAIENPGVPPGDSDWTYYQGNLYQVTNPQIVSGNPAFSCGLNQGTVYFDDFVVNEYDESQNLARQIMSIDIETDEDVSTSSGIDPFISEPKWWDAWSEDGGGSHETATTGHRGGNSLSITGVTRGYSLNLFTFVVKQGHHYQMSGWMKGEGVTDESCQMTLEFSQIPAGEEFTPFDRNYLETALLDYLEFGAIHNVPLNVGEFGLTRWCFEGDRGGVIWVKDMLELFEQYDLNFEYWDYHSYDFGLYRNEAGLPDPASANQDLIDLFTESFDSSNK